MASAISPRLKSPTPNARSICCCAGTNRFPAIVTDRRWNVLQANGAATRLMTMLLGAERMTRPLNHMRMFLSPDELRPYVENWPKVASALLVRARHEAMAAPLDLALQSTWRELLKLPDLPVAQFDEHEIAGAAMRGAPAQGRCLDRPDRRGADAWARRRTSRCRNCAWKCSCRRMGIRKQRSPRWRRRASSPSRSGFPAGASNRPWPCCRSSRR